MKARIIIVDDHKMVRGAWSFLLNRSERFTVVAECNTGEDAVRLAGELMPDIILMDINLPGINGFEAAEEIKKFAPAIKVVGVSQHNMPFYAMNMIRHGGSGYITKTSELSELMVALDEVQKGHTYICKEIQAAFSGQEIIGEGVEVARHFLSKRELEIVRYIKKGYSSKEIASQLYLSVKTVEVHRYNILKKLNLKNSAALVHFISQQSVDLFI